MIIISIMCFEHNSNGKIIRFFNISMNANVNVNNSYYTPCLILLHNNSSWFIICRLL